MRLNELRFVAAALALHLMLPALAEMAPMSDAISTAPALQPTETFDIDVAPPPQPSPTETPTEPEPSDDVQQAVPPTPNRASAAIEPPSITTAAPISSATNPDDLPKKPAVITSPGGSAADEYEQPPAMLPGAGKLPGLGGGPIWKTLPDAVENTRPVGPAAPTKIAPRKIDKKAAERAVQDAVRKKDKRFGLDFPAGGAIASVVRATVRDSEAPHVCSAGFSVRIGPSGSTRSVSLLYHQGGTGGLWRGIKQRVFNSLKGRSFPMKSDFSKGAMVNVTVRSTKRKPAGGVSRKGLGISFDPSDIGARDTRMVNVGVSAEPIR